MPELITRNAKLVPVQKGQHSAQGLATAFVYESEDPADSRDSLFAVIEVLGPIREAEAVTDIIIETLGQKYYENEGNILERFDAAIKSVNHRLSDLASNGQAAWIGRLSSVLGVASGEELHIAHTGSAEASLLRKGQMMQIAARENGAHQSHKPFTSIASGRLSETDRLLFSTPALFHMISRQEIKRIIGDSAPTSAIRKIHDLIQHQNSLDRVAAIVVEITTPNLVSATPITEEPEEIQLGRRESLLDNAKAEAIPLAQKALKHSKKGAQLAYTHGRKAAALAHSKTKEHILPRIRRGGIRAAGLIRQAIRNPKQSKGVIAAIAAAVLLIAFVGFRTAQAGRVDDLIDRYDHVLSLQQEGQNLWLAGDRSQAESVLTEANDEANALSKAKGVSRLSAALEKRQRPEYDPKSLDELRSMIGNLLDQINGITRIEPSVLTESELIKESDIKYLAAAGDKLVLVGNEGRLLIFDPSNNKLSEANAKADLGKVVGADAASSGDGVYLLTDQPGVWLYRPGDDTLAQQNVTDSGRDIASYAGNLYILTDGGINRYVPIESGFSSPTQYLSEGQAGHLGNASALDVDGSVLAGPSSGSGVKRFFNGALTQEASGLPEEGSQPRSIQSLADGALIVLVDDKSGRISTLNFDGTNLAFSRQYQLGDSRVSTAVAADAATVYALTGNKLVKFTLVP